MLRLWHAVVLAALLVVAGTQASAYQVNLLTQGVVGAILALAVWFLLRVCDRPSLGHAAFYGVAAYGTGIAVTRWDLRNVWVVMSISVLAALLAGLVVAIASRRLNHVHFLLVTLAFAEMLRALTTRWRELGGDDGLTGVTRPSAWPLPLDITDSRNLLWFSIAMLTTVVALLVIVTNSPFGAALFGMRDSESRMASLGYDPYSYRMIGFVLSAGIAGIAGSLFAIHTRFVSPSELSTPVSSQALLIVVIGGGASILGPVAVSIGLVYVEARMSSITNHWVGVIGALYVLIALARTVHWHVVLDRVRGLFGVRRSRSGRPAADVGVSTAHDDPRKKRSSPPTATEVFAATSPTATDTEAS